MWRHRAVKRLMAHARADHEPAILHGKLAERLDAVDVDEMVRTRQAKRHRRHEALSAGQHAPVVRRMFGQQDERLLDRLRRVILERGGLHGGVRGLFEIDT
jgi:hypothetical protein